MPNIPMILIVDDQLTNRELLTDLIATMELDSQMAEDGEKALAMMEKQHPDLVLLDITMPKMDGYELLNRIKADEDLRHIPVIMITGLTDVDNVVKCLEMGADDYLTKPFNATLLRARIRGSLEKKLLHDREKLLHKELKDSYDALQKADQARDSLTQMIVHDLNNPLASIHGFTQLLKMEFLKPKYNVELIDHCINKISNSGKYLISLVQGILDVSKFEEGEMPVSLTSVDIVTNTKAILTQFEGQIENQNIELCFESVFNEMNVLADRELLSRITNNLVSNALKHTRQGTKVTCTVTLENNRALLCIADNGLGIPKEYQDKIFDKFFQVEARKEGKMYGVGLGLAFCKMATEALSGNIWVESEAGIGSRFLVSFDIFKD